MLLNADQRMVQEAVRAFAQEQLWPNAAAWDKSHTFPVEAHRGLAALGCYGICVPEDLGGAGMDYVSLAVVLEEIAAGDGGTSTVISVTNCPVNAILMKHGNAAQQAEWLTPLARGDMLGAFCLTEPHVGSDASGLRTTAVRDGDHYVLTGVKQFITSGQNGDVAIVIAVTDKAAGKRGMSAFLVPTSTPGYTVARLEDKLGQHSSDTAQILLTDCRIPETYRLGEEGDGYRIALGGLEGGRIGIAAQSIGMARSALRQGPNVLWSTHHEPPSGGVQTGRYGDPTRSSPRPDAARSRDAGCGGALFERGGDGQAVCQRNGRTGLLPGHPSAWRLWLPCRLPGGADLP